MRRQLFILVGLLFGLVLSVTWLGSGRAAEAQLAVVDTSSSVELVQLTLPSRPLIHVGNPNLLVNDADRSPFGGLLSGITSRVSVASDGTQGNNLSLHSSISADGRYVAFWSRASNLVSGDTNDSYDIFVHDRQTGQTSRVSVASDGTQGNSSSGAPSISADGRYVAFGSWASNLIQGDTNYSYDSFVHDRQTGQTSRVSVASDGTQGNAASSSPSISADGRYVAFYSDANNLVPGDTNDTGDSFVHDLQTGQTSRVSIASDGTQGNDLSYAPSISADGRYVAFVSDATNLILDDTNELDDVFIYDRQTGQTSRVSVASDFTQGNGTSWDPSISADGRYVAFQSEASNLVPGDTNSWEDIFVHDRQTGQITRVSIASDGTQGNGESSALSISADGRYVSFRSLASNLVPDDTNGEPDVFVYDRLTGQTNHISVATDGTQGNGESSAPSISADGRYVAFWSFASNLVPGDTNYWEDVFVHDRGEDQELTTAIMALISNSNGHLQLVSYHSADVAVAGDYFLDEVEAGRVELVVNTAMDLWALRGVDWSLVQTGLNHITTPGYKAALNASWNGWTTGSPAARHWHKPLYDAIHNNRQLLFNQVSRAGLLYYSDEILEGPVKDWLIQELVPGPGTPIADQFHTASAELAASYQAELLSEQAQILAELPHLNLTPEEIAAYQADIVARQEAHSQMVGRLTSHRNLIWESYQDSLEDDASWLNFWGPLLTKWVVVGACTLAWDGPGYYVSSTGFAIYNAVSGTRELLHDGKMLDQSLRYLSGRTSLTYQQIALNTVASLNIIRAGDPPQIAEGAVGSVAEKSFGHYRIWPNLWWAEESSQVELPVTNSGDYSTTYLTSAAYTTTSFWVGPQRFLPEGNTPELEPNTQDTAVIGFKGEDEGLSPDEGSIVDLLVLGATETGLYPVEELGIIWEPERVESLTGRSGRIPSGYTEAQAADAPAYAFPLSSASVVANGTTNQQLIISASNPFSLTVAATLTQTVPSEFTIVDSAGATLVGNALVWTEILTPGLSLEVRPILHWEGTPGSNTILPGAQLAFEDPNTGEGDTYIATDEEISAPWSLEVTTELPPALRSGETMLASVTLNNVSTNTFATGEFIATVNTPEGESLWSIVMPVNVAPQAAQMLSMPILFTTDEKYVVVSGSVVLGTVEQAVFLEIIPVESGKVYLPVILDSN